ncbi:MAG: sorbosone dehydrogenase family protein [Alphaproteobacteria bacterium]|nr:sorbosone dehydrogenase family protein [Alphaproteobacteria bacterium]
MARRSACLAVALTVIGVAAGVLAAEPPKSFTGQAAYGDWRSDAPGVRRKIGAADLPPPYATPIARETARVVPRPTGAQLAVPAGFSVSLIAERLAGPRAIRVAPNGDIFVAESRAGQVRVLHPAQGGRNPEQSVFAAGLGEPFGVAFWPPGPAPQYVYVATTMSVVRFPYRDGDLKAGGPPETVVPKVSQSGAGHWTRDIAFSRDGKRMFVSVGSGSNDAEGMPRELPDGWTASHALGAAWGYETDRADVLEFDPQGQGRRVYATGIRNCVGLAVEPKTGDLWCSTNERDGLGDNLPPDYLTRVKEGGFYGWPWYYIGDHEDPHHNGERPDLAGRIAVPDVLIQPHSAPLEMAFYDGSTFPAEYRGSAFAALHGSWNRHNRTGYKIVRAILYDGVPTGEYEDFVTGFVTADGSVWGRPVGVAVAKDGALLFSEDGNGSIWRVTYSGQQAEVH